MKFSRIDVKRLLETSKKVNDSLLRARIIDALVNDAVISMSMPVWLLEKVVSIVEEEKV